MQGTLTGSSYSGTAKEQTTNEGEYPGEPTYSSLLTSFPNDPEHMLIISESGIHVDDQLDLEEAFALLWGLYWWQRQKDVKNEPVGQELFRSQCFQMSPPFS
eukprot:GHVS01087148.1.p1 GENE.GHVS01087148.1~~GHVS01087148.1.p1  ORF type:complete len:102 (-),score=9.12 GHVS01087148.1:146-451(-)